MKLSDSIEMLGLSLRTFNAFAKLGVTTVNDIVNLPSSSFDNWPGLGDVGVTETLQALLQRHIRPPWMKVVANKHIDRDIMDRPPDGYRCLADGFAPTESWVRECIIADLERGDIEWVMAKTKSGHPGVFRKGGIEVDEDEE